jgi:hypothetical protein
LAIHSSGIKDGFSQMMRFQQMAEFQQGRRGFSIQVKPAKCADSLDIQQRGPRRYRFDFGQKASIFQVRKA